MVTSVIFQVGLLFLLMIPGILLKKLGMVPDGFGKGVSNLVLYIAQPALIFLAYLKDFSMDILINAGYVLILSVIVHTLFSVVAMMLFNGAPDGQKRMLRFATIFSNAAFMGIPLIAAVLEADYPGATLYASIYNITFNLFLWSLGVKICTKGRDANDNGIDDHHEAKAEGGIMKALLHPVTIAAAVGLVFFIAPISQYIPSILLDTAGHLRNLVAPLSMLVIGLRIPDIKLRGMFSDKYLYLFLALRHILLPLAVVGILKLVLLIPGLNIGGAVAPVVLILAAAPAASSATMFAEKYDCDATYVSRLVTVSTLLSIATMPLMIMFI